MGSRSRAAPLRPFDPCPANPILRPPQHRAADPEHRPRRPGRGTRRVVVDGAARGPAGRHAGLACARPGDLPGPGHLGRRLAGRRRGRAGHGRAAVAALPVAPPAVRDDFDADRLHPHWVSLRSRPAECWSTTQRPGWLRLRARGSSMDDADVTFMGRRQPCPSCRVRTLIDPTDGRGGLSVRLDEQHHYDIEVGDGEVGSARASDPWGRW